MAHTHFPRGAVHIGSAWTRVWVVVSCFPVDFRLLIFGLQLRGNFAQRIEKWRQKNTSSPSLFPHHLNWVDSMEEPPGAVYNPNSDWTEEISMLQHLPESRRDTGNGTKKDERNYLAELPPSLVIKPIPYPQVQQRLVWLLVEGGGGWHFRACCTEPFFIYFWGSWRKYELKAKDCGGKYL